jgi:hypothetical protein
MIKKKELEDWANDLKPVLFDINLSLNNLRILKDERLTYFSVNYFDAYLNLSYQQHFILVIQIDKIFTNCKWHKRNVHAFFREIETKELDPEILSDNNNNTDNYVSQEEVFAAIKELKQAISKCKKNTKRIRLLRNQVFAHSDPKYPDGTIEIEEYAVLAKLSYHIYNTLFGRLLGVNYIFKPNIANSFDLRCLLDLLPADTNQ